MGNEMFEMSKEGYHKSLLCMCVSSVTSHHSVLQ